MGVLTRLQLPLLTLLGLLYLNNFVHAQASTNVYCDVTLSSSGRAGANRGLQYIYYDTIPYVNTVQGSNIPPANRYPTYDPVFVNVLQPIYVGQTEFLGFARDAAFNTPARYYPDSPNHLITNVTLVHRGYLYARTTGTYTFRASFVDDIVHLWLGDNAYSGYTRDNANQVFAYGGPSQTAGSYTFSLTAGQYLPMRIQYSNAQEAGALTYSIINPAGEVLLDADTSVDIVTQPCDGSAQFPAYYSGEPFCTVSGSDTSSDGAGNRGLQYGIWNSSAVNSNTASQTNGFSNYPVNSFDNVAAVHLGVTNRIGLSAAASAGDRGQVVSIYSDTNLRFYSAFITIIHRGYLYARASGSYTFTVPYNDDIILVWVGSNAVSGYTRANADVVSATTSNSQTRTFTHFLNAGQYLPIRIQWDNAEGGATLAFSITDPSGNTILGNTVATDSFFQSCPGQLSNGNEIPQFSPWFANSTSYTTTTSTVIGTATSTTTVARPSGTNPGTVLVIVPAMYTTITGPYTGTDPQPGTFTSTIADPSGTAQGTVEVFTPASYNTITRVYTGIGITTSTVAQPTDDTPGTIAVLVPATFATITRLYSGSETETNTIYTPTDAAPGTVELLVPTVYVTTTQPYEGPGYLTGPFTSTVAQPMGTTPGTIAVLTPTVTRPLTLGTTLGPNTCVCRPAY